jgi:hypothetical protein
VSEVTKTRRARERRTNHLDRRPVGPQQSHVIPEQTQDRTHKGEAHDSDDKAANDVRLRRPGLAVIEGGRVEGLGVTTIDVPGGEGEDVDGAKDGRDEEGNKGGVVASADALMGSGRVSSAGGG